MFYVDEMNPGHAVLAISSAVGISLSIQRVAVRGSIVGISSFVLFFSSTTSVCQGIVAIIGSFGRTGR